MLACVGVDQVRSSPPLAKSALPGLSHRLALYRAFENSREKWRKWIFVTGSLRGQAQVRLIDKLDEACTNAEDLMMLVQHRSGDRVMS